mmetsp:Transcript_60342/g.143769  ORF Transcript_60342/g.143769 Transcript_60342/m.143769 type:complete len:950 (+) Transcript_60342:51-2900(+)
MTPRRVTKRHVCIVNPQSDLGTDNFSFRDSSVSVATQDAGCQQFPFDKVFAPRTPQDAIFDAVARSAVLDALENWHSTTFVALGASGSGKTFSMTGGAKSFADRGLIPRSMSLLFEALSERIDANDFQIAVTFYEIYKESVVDLLTERRRRVALHPAAGGAQAILDSLKVLPASNESEAYQHLFRGDSNRHFQTFPLNDETSRGHVFFTVHISNRTTGRKSTLTFVDVAATVATMNHATSAIAQGLASLRSALLAMHEGRNPAFDSSLLVQLLQPSLQPRPGTSPVQVVSLCPVRFHSSMSEEIQAWFELVKLLRSATERPQSKMGPEDAVKKSSGRQDSTEQLPSAPFVSQDSSRGDGGRRHMSPAPSSAAPSTNAGAPRRVSPQKAPVRSSSKAAAKARPLAARAAARGASPETLEQFAGRLSQRCPSRSSRANGSGGAPVASKNLVQTKGTAPAEAAASTVLKEKENIEPINADDAKQPLSDCVEKSKALRVAEATEAAQVEAETSEPLQSQSCLLQLPAEDFGDPAVFDDISMPLSLHPLVAGSSASCPPPTSTETLMQEEPKDVEEKMPTAPPQPSSVPGSGRTSTSTRETKTLAAGEVLSRADSCSASSFSAHAVPSTVGASVDMASASFSAPVPLPPPPLAPYTSSFYADEVVSRMRWPRSAAAPPVCIPHQHLPGHCAQAHSHACHSIESAPGWTTPAPTAVPASGVGLPHHAHSVLYSASVPVCWPPPPAVQEWSRQRQRRSAARSMSRASERSCSPRPSVHGTAHVVLRPGSISPRPRWRSISPSTVANEPVQAPLRRNVYSKPPAVTPTPSGVSVHTASVHGSSALRARSPQPTQFQTISARPASRQSTLSPRHWQGFLDGPSSKKASQEVFPRSLSPPSNQEARSSYAKGKCFAAPNHEHHATAQSDIWLKATTPLRSVVAVDSMARRSAHVNGCCL